MSRMLAVRPLAEADRAAWLPLWQGYLDFYGATLSDAVTARCWARLMDPLIDMHAIGAEADGRLIGICHYVFHPATWTVGPYCYLEDLYVDPAARGRGAGRALIEAVYRAADARDAGRVYWLTQTDNETARRLYDTLATVAPFVQYRR